MLVAEFKIVIPNALSKISCLERQMFDRTIPILEQFPSYIGMLFPLKKIAILEWKRLLCNASSEGVIVSGGRLSTPEEKGEVNWLKKVSPGHKNYVEVINHLIWNQWVFKYQSLTLQGSENHNVVTARVFKAVPLNQIASFNFTVKWHQRQSSPGPDSDLQGGFKVEGDWALEKSTVVKRHSHN